MQNARLVGSIEAGNHLKHRVDGLCRIHRARAFDPALQGPTER
jgi:hypothetical protein